jgi:Arc/MetJ-type ribon-helix-helix transcriptional regulator
MDEADQAYHHRVGIAIRAMAMFEARKAVKRDIQAKGLKLGDFWKKDVDAMAKALIAANSAEYLAKAKASSVVRDTITELREREVRKLLRKLERKSRHMRKSGTLAANGLSLNEYHAQNGEAK